VSNIDLICEACGEPNPPGTQFCRNCNEFLAWDKATESKPSGPTTQSTVPVTPVTQQTVPSSQQPTTPIPLPADRAGENETTLERQYVDPGYPDQTYVDQTQVDQAFVDQGYADQTYVDQGYADQTYADQGYPDQGYPDQRYVDQPPAELTCPTCSTVNPGTRRYCGHCGYSFVAASGTDPYVDWSAWTPQAMAARDREAAREYRRSLPPLYRWRRVIIGVLVFVLFVGFGAVLQLGPTALAQNGWHRLTKQYVAVSGVQVMVNPTTASAPDSNPQALVDSSRQEWTMAWAPTGSSAACGAAPGTGTLIFTFPATRVRQVVIWSGLDADNPQRALQPQPQVIGIGFPDGSCQTADLTQTTDPQRIAVDSGAPVTQLRLGIASTFPTTPEMKQVVSLTEVSIRTFPR
jgi:hypothetical protein